MAPKAKLVAYHPVHGYKIKPAQDLKTIKRNERERKRVEVVNKGFETLRQHVPSAVPVKKMSKVGILNEAMEYIAYLRTVLVQQSASEPVLLNYTQHIPHQYQPQQPFLDQQQPSPRPSPAPQPQFLAAPPSPAPPPPPGASQLYSPYQGLSSDQGFVSDYSSSQPSPAWHSPHPQYHHQQVQQVSSSSAQFPNIKFEKDEESSGDEDDILDAIAEWRQQ